MPPTQTVSESPIRELRVKKAVGRRVHAPVRSWKRMSVRLGGIIKRFVASVMAFTLENTPTLKFNNGIEFPIFGLGTWKVSLLLPKCDEGLSCRPASVSWINVCFTVFKACVNS